MINNYKNLINKVKNIKSGDPPLSDDEILDIIDGKRGSSANPSKFSGFLKKNSTILIIAGLMLSVFSFIYSYNAVFKAGELNDPRMASKNSIEFENTNAALVDKDFVIVKKETDPTIRQVYEVQNKDKKVQNNEPQAEIAFSGSYKNNTALNKIKNNPKTEEFNAQKESPVNDIAEMLELSEETYESTNFGVSLLYGGGFLTNNVSASYLRKSPAQMYFADIVFNFSIPFKDDQCLRFDLGYSPNVYGISIIDQRNEGFTDNAHINTVYLKYGMTYGYKRFYAGVNFGIPLTKKIFNGERIPGYAVEFLDYKPNNIFEVKAGYEHPLFNAPAGNFKLKVEASYNINSLNEGILRAGQITLDEINVLSIKAGLNFTLNKGFGIK